QGPYVIPVELALGEGIGRRPRNSDRGETAAGPGAGFRSLQSTARMQLIRQPGCVLRAHRFPEQDQVILLTRVAQPRANKEGSLGDVVLDLFEHQLPSPFVQVQQRKHRMASLVRGASSHRKCSATPMPGSDFS